MRCIFIALLLTNVAAVARSEVLSGPNLTVWKEGQANASAAAAAVAAKDAKMAAVNKIVTMLSDLQAKVIAEGEAEAKTYSEFACFCKDTISEKTASIKTGEDNKASLEAAIAEGASLRDELDTKISELVDTIEAAHANVTKAKEIRAQELAVYKAQSADVEAGLVALDGAIKALKASKKPAFVQLQGVAKTVRTAALIADALGLVKGSAAGPIGVFLQEEPEVPFENYKFHSSDIISTLEELGKSFKNTKDELDAAEVTSKKDHTMYLQSMDAMIKDLNYDLDATKAKKADTIAKIKADSEELSTVAAQLLDDQQYLETLAQMCKDKKKTWDQRSSTRADELYTITQVLGIIQGAVSNKTRAETVRFNQAGVSLRIAKAVAMDRSAMEAVEAEAEAAEGQPSAFLQRTSAQRHASGRPVADGREIVVSLLKSKGQQLKSQVLASLVTQISAVQGEDPFGKIKTLIQELIERLLQEAANEANQKGWCDKATSAATQKRDYAVEEIRSLNAEMAELEALRDKLAEELSVLADEIAELVASRKTAEEIRAKEKAENEFTVAEAQAGLEAINMAMDILDKWYKTNAKNEVSLSQQGPADDAPDAGFDNFEAYKGAQAESGGIIGMMEVIASDFSRTITETQKAEAAAEDEHLEFMTATGKSLGEKKVIEEQKTTEKDNAEEDLQAADDKLQSNNNILQTSITELLELKAACIDTGMSYRDRVANREDEIEALKKALCILGAYEKFGPDGASDAC
mmetsp:Transcript_95025/g.251026  ORF Transcript_95025/g.251026 Transcript_95025/m.251026 type:complete len:751 (+) Transcript_95025:79-2331(+)